MCSKNGNSDGNELLIIHQWKSVQFCTSFDTRWKGDQDYYLAWKIWCCDISIKTSDFRRFCKNSKQARWKHQRIYWLFQAYFQWSKPAQRNGRVASGRIPDRRLPWKNSDWILWRQYIPNSCSKSNPILKPSLFAIEPNVNNNLFHKRFLTFWFP